MKHDEEDGERRPALRRPPLGGGCTQQLAAQLLEAQQVHNHLIGVIGDLSGVLEQMAPQVIGVQTVALDANGTAAAQYRLPFQALFVDSMSGSRLTVANQPLQGAAPGPGPGVAVIRPNGNAVVNFRAYQWSLYGGQPGELVTVTAFARPHPAAASSGPTAALAAVTASVPASAASVPLFAPAAAPNGRMVFNDSTAVLYLKYGSAASTTSYTAQVAPGGYFEFPAPVYAGEVDGIWSAANGNARLTSW